MKGHVALLGDSVFDNAAYVGAGEAVIDHLRARLGADWRASLIAVDGTTTGDFAPQLSRIPKDATHLVVSLGGNDAILNADLLGTPVASTGEALELFGQRMQAFESAYAQALDRTLRHRLPTCVCTIYNGNLTEAEAPTARVALSLFNDALLRVAIERRLPVIDLRFVCNQQCDYANPIEPSAIGGAKIAQAIATVLRAPPHLGGQTFVVSG